MASDRESDISEEVEKDTQTQALESMWQESDNLKLGEPASGSRKSRRSSASSALLKTAAKRAALTAELTFLKRQQE